MTCRSTTISDHRTNTLKRLRDSWLGNAISPPPSYTASNYRRIYNLVKEMGPHAMILEVGAGGSRRLSGVIGVDIEPGEGVDVLADAHSLPFADGSFDGVLFISVLEHLREPSLAVAEAHRVLRGGGLVFADTPFLLGYHAVPHDYTRWTLQGLDTLFSRFSKVDSGVANGPSATLVEIIRSWASLLSDNDIIASALSLLAGWLFFPLKYLDHFLAKRKKAHTIAFGLYYAGRK